MQAGTRGEFWLVFCYSRRDARSSISLWVQFRGLSNADSLGLRVTKPPPNSPAERCCFALIIGCARRMSLLEEIGWSQFLLGVVAEG